MVPSGRRRTVNIGAPCALPSIIEPNATSPTPGGQLTVPENTGVPPRMSGLLSITLFVIGRPYGRVVGGFIAHLPSVGFGGP